MCESSHGTSMTGFKNLSFRLFWIIKSFAIVIREASFEQSLNNLEIGIKKCKTKLIAISRNLGSEIASRNSWRPVALDL